MQIFGFAIKFIWPILTRREEMITLIFVTSSEGQPEIFILLLQDVRVWEFLMEFKSHISKLNFTSLQHSACTL